MNGPIEKVFVVASELGLHARPAGEFANLAGRFDAEVEVSRGGEWVSGRSVLSLLSLGASRGTALHVRAEGPGAAKAVDALGALIERPELPA